MADAAAKAAEVPAAELRRAVMLHGDLGDVAATAMAGGVPALREIGLQVGRGIRPMLASPAADIDVAMEKLSPAAVEWKLDGIRAQVHRDGNDVAVFSRTLDDITERVPGIVEAALALPVRSVVLDGEAIALREDGRPRAFQDTASRGHRLQALYFDVLHLDGEDVLDEPGAARAERLAAVVPEALRVPRLVAADAEAAGAVLDEALAMGHEGVIVKSLDAPYAAGRRGAGWLKVKPVHTLDLVILAAEWGHGRRRGWLSNLHLGARHDTEPGQFVMLGKTFKGLTDKMLQWQTEALLELATDRGDWVVHVRPELVVEIAFDGIQRSTRYPGGVALRFARVLRHRPDKRAEEADTLASVLAVG
jgi:DNA ligase-1